MCDFVQAKHITRLGGSQSRHVTSLIGSYVSTGASAIFHDILYESGSVAGFYTSMSLLEGTWR